MSCLEKRKNLFYKLYILLQLQIPFPSDAPLLGWELLGIAQWLVALVDEKDCLLIVWPS